MFNKQFKIIFLLLLTLIVAGCGNTYRYYSFKARAEEAIKQKKYETAKDLYATIYQNEKAAAEIDQEKICWAFYRLGVVNELMGETRLAKGYYWGDSLEEGFYADQPRIEWFAETGWLGLDHGDPPRTLKQILDLEKQFRPSRKLKTVKKKKFVKTQTKTVRPMPTFGQKQNPIPTDQPVRIFNRSLTPPPSYFPEPFRVFY